MIRPRYGNCMTDEVTEMPRCCSRRIQSDVAWRAALRPLTVPAIWMAPPNSSSFSVSVVFPASGCEMIAKLRRRVISSFAFMAGRGSRGARDCSGSGCLQRAELEAVDQGVLAAGCRLVIAAPRAYALEAESVIERDRRAVAATHLEERIAHAAVARMRKQRDEQLAAGPAPAQGLRDAEVQHVRFTRAHRQHAVAGDALARLDDDAVVTDPQAVGEDLVVPWEFVGRAFERRHVRQVGLRHRPQVPPGDRKVVTRRRHGSPPAP